MIRPLTTNLLPTTTLGLAAAPVNRPSLASVSTDSFEQISGTEPSLNAITPHSLFEEPQTNSTPDGSIGVSAALFTGAFPATDDIVQGISAHLSAVLALAHQYPDYALVALIYSIPLLRIVGRGSRLAWAGLAATVSVGKMIVEIFQRNGSNEEEISPVNGSQFEPDSLDMSEPLSIPPTLPPYSIDPSSQAHLSKREPVHTMGPLSKTVAITNYATGSIDQAVHPWRETAVLLHGLYVLCGGSSPVIDSGASALAVALAIYVAAGNMFFTTYRLYDAQARQESALLPMGWKRQRAMQRGIFPPRVPHFEAADVFDPRKGLHFANDYGPLGIDHLVEGILGREHKLYSALGHIEIVKALLIAFLQQRSIEGAAWVKEARVKVMEGEGGPVSERFIPYASIILLNFSIQWLYRHRVDFTIEGMDKIPSGPIVGADFGHCGLYDNFAESWLHNPLVRHYADKKNFGKAFNGRLGQFLDAVAYLYIVRSSSEAEKRKNRALFRENIRRVEKYGVQPYWYAHGTRVSKRYNDDGTLSDMPSYYTTGKRGRASRYVHSGFARDAVEMAYFLGQPVHVVVHTLQGPLIMPKRAKRPEHLQKNVRRQKVTKRIAHVIKVKPVASKEQMQAQAEAIFEEAKLKAREDLGIDKFLVDLVGQWHGQDVAETFQAKADARTDEKLYILADCISCIPPSMPEREEYKNTLKEMARRGYLDSELDQALEAVVAILRKTDYIN